MAVYPVGGKIFQCTAKIDTRMTASQKLGTARPKVEKVAGTAVDGPLGPDARDEAHGDAHDEGHDGRGHHEAEGDREPLLNLLGHRLTGRDGGAEVAVQRVVEPVPVLDEQGIVEMELGP